MKSTNIIPVAEVASYLGTSPRKVTKMIINGTSHRERSRAYKRERGIYNEDTALSLGNVDKGRIKAVKGDSKNNEHLGDTFGG